LALNTYAISSENCFNPLHIGVILSNSIKTLLEHPNVPKTLETVIRTALDDNHKNQTAAQKFLMDRILPISTFEKAVDSREKINIVINTIRPEKEAIKGEVIE
tara:strand:- start:60 stop:368 length:309 start_codon:yes stop_codon:yes gene_type:complete